MNIHLIYDIKEFYGIDSADIEYVDFSYLSEVEFVKKNLELAGYNVILVKMPEEFIKLLRADYKEIDIVFNMSEGFKSRNREGIVPALCEAFDIPYIGPDAYAASFTLHKHQTKLFVDDLGITTPKGFLLDECFYDEKNIQKQIKKHDINFPLIVKPNHEGSSMGVYIIQNLSELLFYIPKLFTKYQQELVIEEYIKGKEISVQLIGNDDEISIFSTVQYINSNNSNIELFTTIQKEQNLVNMCRPDLSQEVLDIIHKQSVLCYKSLKLYDYARIDWRIDPDEKPYLLEVTPLPNLCEGAEFDWGGWQKGLVFPQVLNLIVNTAMKRYNLKGLESL